MTDPEPEPLPPDPLLQPWRPTIDDVAALIRARTKDASMHELGTFTDQTRPTDAEVEQLITNGMAKVASYVGWDLPPEAFEEGRHLAAIVAACEIELSYWPEQVRTERSPFAQLWAMFELNMPQFVDFVAIYRPLGVGAELGTVGAVSSTVVFAYTWGFGYPFMSDMVNVGLPARTRSSSRRRVRR